jgi:D-cysteine desulfhydrase family pyridoxal phosphate-dependent enzyme
MKMTDKIGAAIKKIPSLNLSILPTVIHKLDNLSKDLGAEIYCKRDDLTGFAFGGNKTRKLDYLIKDAIDKGSDSIITFGSNQSNWCRMTSAAGSSNGLDVYLILAGKKPESPSANLILDHLVGANIIHIDTEDEEILVNACLELENKLKGQGRNPYFISVGGSNAIGSIGYVRAFMEILNYNELTGIDFSKIIITSGSAGTQAGLIAGKLLSGWVGRIIGMAVSRSSKEQSDKVFEITRDTLKLTGSGIGEEDIRKAVIIDDNYLGEGYRRNTRACGEAIRIFARLEGIILDEVYTGKAASGLIDYIRKGKLTRDEPVLFIHTGGSIQLFE